MNIVDAFRAAGDSVMFNLSNGGYIIISNVNNLKADIIIRDANGKMVTAKTVVADALMNALA